MKPTQRLILTVAVSALIAAPLLADDLGAPATELQIAEWFLGDPVTLADGKGKTIFVIEFWSTTSQPCLDRVPALNVLQEKYKDQGVVLLALTLEKAPQVKAFVEKHRSKILYRVAADKDRATVTAYAGAFAFGRVPWMLVIDKEGRVVWSGAELGRAQTALDELLAGTYDLETARKEENARRALVLYFRAVKSISKAETARPLGDTVLENGRSNMNMMNDFAWRIVAEPGLFKRDYELATRAAQIAYEACKGEHPGVLDTYARVLWETGKKAEAIEHQKKAVELAEGKDMQAELRTTLERYQTSIERE